MLNFIFKWWLIFYKKYLLFSIRSERTFFENYFTTDLDNDVDDLMEQFEKLKKEADKNGPELNQLQAKIVKTRQIQERISNSERVENELQAFIDTLKKM